MDLLQPTTKTHIPTRKMGLILLIIGGLNIFLRAEANPYLANAGIMVTIAVGILTGFVKIMEIRDKRRAKRDMQKYNELQDKYDELYERYNKLK